ncbi:putative bacterial type II secretion system protein [Synechococcus sp. BIOS-U3-1]|uniref:DUF6554 family protein n=1 Tax=Synechococcus sp. BIOS-U3-1 TaxID=1400865 RepID=UPI001648D2BA|nr:DUF6554 family protein [Synechococcus sp. BIOS-U3-1]QNI56965.1 putative bacterial type II secretion system protein [Synechococcus sp. BIOS-U3-1]
MASLRTRLAVLLPLTGMLLTAAPVGAESAGSEKGAQVYCYMRSNGNDHSVSFEASYALIKRQSSGVFKTSPEHAAVMITETVVDEPGSYPDCGRYLGDLFGGKTSKKSSSAANTSSITNNSSNSESSADWDADDRYSY